MTDSVKKGSTYLFLASLLSVFFAFLHFFDLSLFLPLFPHPSVLFYLVSSLSFLPSIVLSMLALSTFHPLYSASSPADAVSALSLCLLDRTWELSHQPSRAFGSCKKNWKLLKKFCLKSTRKIHYLDCSLYSLDSNVSNFNLLRSKDVPFQDDTYYPFC